MNQAILVTKRHFIKIERSGLPFAKLMRMISTVFSSSDNNLHLNLRIFNSEWWTTIIIIFVAPKKKKLSRKFQSIWWIKNKMGKSCDNSFFPPNTNYQVWNLIFKSGNLIHFLSIFQKEKKDSIALNPKTSVKSCMLPFPPFSISH